MSSYLETSADMSCWAKTLFLFIRPHHVGYGFHYLRIIEALPANVLQHFMKGSHVTRPIKGMLNCMWSGMFIEMTISQCEHVMANQELLASH